MKKDIKFFLIFVCIILTAGCREKFDPLQSTNADNTYIPDPGSVIITILSPKEGDSYRTGNNLLVKWEITGVVKLLRIQLFKDDQFERSISLNATNSNVLSWYIPNTLESSRNYKIKITDGTNTDIFTFSPAFAIIQNN